MITFNTYLEEQLSGIKLPAELNSKREIERFEAKLKKQGYKKDEAGSNDDGFVNIWTKGSDKVEVSADNQAEGRRGVTGYARKI